MAKSKNPVLGTIPCLKCGEPAQIKRTARGRGRSVEQLLSYCPHCRNMEQKGDDATQSRLAAALENIAATPHVENPVIETPPPAQEPTPAAVETPTEVTPQMVQTAPLGGDFIPRTHDGREKRQAPAPAATTQQNPDTQETTEAMEAATPAGGKSRRVGLVAGLLTVGLILVGIGRLA